MYWIRYIALGEAKLCDCNFLNQLTISFSDIWKSNLCNFWKVICHTVPVYKIQEYTRYDIHDNLNKSTLTCVFLNDILVALYSQKPEKVLKNNMMISEGPQSYIHVRILN